MTSSLTFSTSAFIFSKFPSISALSNLLNDLSKDEFLEVVLYVAVTILLLVYTFSSKFVVESITGDDPWNSPSLIFIVFSNVASLDW